MMPRTIAGPALLALAGLATPAFAQEAPAATFDGPYVSGAFGLAVNASDQQHSLVFDTDQNGTSGDQVTTAAGGNAFSPGFCDGEARGATPASGCATDHDNMEYTIRAGYDRRMGPLVVGALVEASGNNAQESTSAFSTTPASYAIRRNLDYAFSARLRAGYSPGSGGILFYATGGAGMGRIDHVFETTNTANSFTEYQDKKMVFGWQAGGGAEAMLTKRLSVGLEYLFNDYHDSRYFVNAGPGTAPETNPFLLRSGATNIRVSEPDFMVHSLRATVSYHF